MRKSYIMASLAAIVALSSCSHVKEEWVEFENDWSALDTKTCFIPYQTSSDMMTENLVNSCVIPGGGTLAEEEAKDTKTTSFNPTALGKEMVSNITSSQSRSYCGTYMSVDQDGNPIRLSGRVILPADGHVSRIMVVGHFTIGNNIEAPSRSFPIEGVFASRGLAVIISDYIGYGVTADKVHPYLCAELTARNVVDMYFATLPFLKHIGCMPEHDDIFIYGYSQGGATAIAVQRLFEVEYPDVKLRLTLAGGGPYDICATYDKLVENDFTDYPCAIPMIIQGINVGAHLNLDYTKYFLPQMYKNLDKWINSKGYYMHEITAMMGSKKLSNILTDNARNKVSEGMDDLYLAMLDNSLSHTYYPQTPIYMFHSMQDTVVPFENAVSMRSHLDRGGVNVTYNFGEYGSHTSGFLRFLFISLTLLENRGDIIKR